MELFSLKLFPYIHDYLFIFANSEIYLISYKTQWKIVKTTFDKFFQCIRYWGFHCMESNFYIKLIEIKTDIQQWQYRFLCPIERACV